MKLDPYGPSGFLLHYIVDPGQGGHDRGETDGGDEKKQGMANLFRGSSRG
jgi:hypothetical protein